MIRFIILIGIISCQTISLNVPTRKTNPYINETYSKNIEIKQSVEDDLKTFKLDYEKYKVDPEQVYQPIIINYVESVNKDNLDLLYIYDPLNNYDLEVVKGTISVGSDKSNLKPLEDNNEFAWNLYYSGKSDDGTIKRYAIDGYEEYRKFNYYRRYDFNELIYREIVDNEVVNKLISLDNSYQFSNASLSQEYSQSLNILLKNANAWSWHFDENLYNQSVWDNIYAFFHGVTAEDKLRDQLFYSFYVDGWEIENIKSVDMKYKKVLLDGYRYNVADSGNEYEWYDPYTLYDVKQQTYTEEEIASIREEYESYLFSYNEYGFIHAGFNPNLSFEEYFEKNYANVWSGEYYSSVSGKTHSYHKNSDNYKPNFYLWDKNNTIDKQVRTTDSLGHSVNTIRHKVPYDYVTINDSEISGSIGTGHKYKWNKIQKLSEFKNIFGENSEIYKFASQFMEENNLLKDYWIINYDSFFYNFVPIEVDYKVRMSSATSSPETGDGTWGYLNLPFTSYLEENTDVKLNYRSDALGSFSYMCCNAYQFTQEYTFDVEVTDITLEDADGTTYTLPVSVAPIDQKSSGGLPDKETNWWDSFLQIVSYLLLAIILIVLFPLITTGVDLISTLFNIIIKFFKRIFKKGS